MVKCKYCQDTGTANMIGPCSQVWAFGCICEKGRLQRLTPWNGQITQEYRGNVMLFEFADEFPELAKRAESGYTRPAPAPRQPPPPAYSAANGYAPEPWDAQD